MEAAADGGALAGPVRARVAALAVVVVVVAPAVASRGQLKLPVRLNAHKYTHTHTIKPSRWLPAGAIQLLEPSRRLEMSGQRLTLSR